MDIFLQKDSTCFPYRLKLNHHNEVKGGKKVQNNINTLLLEIQDRKERERKWITGPKKIALKGVAAT